MPQGKAPKASEARQARQNYAGPGLAGPGLAGAIRGRGAGINPPNRFETIHLHVLGEYRDELREVFPGGRQLPREVIHDVSRTIINHVDSPDIGFSWTVNPYRGCEHGCIYCYARPGHEYLGLSCGLDFETKIHAKLEAPELLCSELMAARWKGETIVMSGVTDPYQPVERELEITRRCLEVMAEFRQPVALITKNRLITRDLDLLVKLHEHRAVSAAVSLTTLDNKLASIMEPRASSPKDRLAAIRELSSAGIPVTVMTAPLIPRINDHEIPALLEAAAEAGATSAGYTFIRLPHQIKDLFLEWLARHFPDRAAHVESLVRQSRGGALYDAAWFRRHRAQGEIAGQVGRTFKLFAARTSLDRPRVGLNTTAFRRPPSQTGQTLLFE
ncbi:MAG: PA0069 family radical SAM protein [Phycisphaerales bacterium]|nr:PA0069 family radical SAM protein [Phycisphaerales bacterium]